MAGWPQSPITDIELSFLKKNSGRFSAHTLAKKFNRKEPVIYKFARDHNIKLITRFVETQNANEKPVYYSSVHVIAYHTLWGTRDSHTEKINTDM